MFGVEQVHPGFADCECERVCAAKYKLDDHYQPRCCTSAGSVALIPLHTGPEAAANEVEEVEEKKKKQCRNVGFPNII